MKSFEQELIGLQPHLTAYAMTLTRSRISAEDLVQDTLVKALQAKTQFRMGTNMKAWSFMIMRNQFYSDMRKLKIRKTVTLDDVERPIKVLAADDQHVALEFQQTMDELDELPEHMREAITLVGLGGYSYEEAAAKTQTCIGTVKSRTSRGRALLERRLDATPAERMREELALSMSTAKFAIRGWTPVPTPDMRSMLANRTLIRERRSRSTCVRTYALA